MSALGRFEGLASSTMRSSDAGAALRVNPATWCKRVDTDPRTGRIMLLSGTTTVAVAAAGTGSAETETDKVVMARTQARQDLNIVFAGGREQSYSRERKRARE